MSGERLYRSRRYRVAGRNNSGSRRKPCATPGTRAAGYPHCNGAIRLVDVGWDLDVGVADEAMHRGGGK